MAGIASVAPLQARSRRELWIVGGLTVLAMVLRFYRLTAESLWYDEAYSVWSSAMDIASPRTLWAWQIEFPLYYWLLHFWMRLFGQGEFAVRAFGALASAASIAPMYYLAKRLFGLPTGEIAAFLLAVNPYHVWYAQDVRMYPWALLFVIASLLAFWRMMQGAGWGWRLAYVLATGLTFHLHYYIGWLVLAENAYVLAALLAGTPAACWPRLRLWLITQLGVAVFAAPAAAVFLTKAVTLNQWDWLAQRYGAPGVRDVIALFESYTVGTLFPAPSLARWAALALYGGLAAWGVWRAWGQARRREAPRGALGFTLLALIVPLGGCFALGQRYSVWVTRYLILFLPLYLILAAQGVASLAPGAPPSWRRAASKMLAFRGAALALLAIVSGYALWAMYTMPQKEDWRGVAAYLAAQVAPDDLIVLLDEECRVPFDYYFGGGGRRVGVSRFADEAALDRAVAEIRQQQRGGRLWLVVSHADSAALEQRLAALPNLAPARAPAFVGVKLLIYRWQ